MTVYRKMWQISILGLFDQNISFSSELVVKQQFMTFFSSLQFVPLNILVHILLKQNMHQNSHFTIYSIYGNLELTKKLFQDELSHKEVKVTEMQISWFVFQDTAAYKRQRRENLRNIDMKRVYWVRHQPHTIIVWEFPLIQLLLLKFYQR